MKGRSKEKPSTSDLDVCKGKSPSCLNNNNKIEMNSFRDILNPVLYFQMEFFLRSQGLAHCDKRSVSSNKQTVLKVQIKKNY